MAKFFSAIFAALTVSLIVSLQDYTPMSERAENVYYYSFGHLFFFGLLIMLGLFILIAIPLSIFIDGLVAMKFKKRSYKQAFVTLIAYCLACSVLGLLFIAFSPIDIERDIIKGLLISSLPMLPFFVFQELFRWIGRQVITKIRSKLD